MRLPKVIKIGGHVFEVKRVKRCEDDADGFYDLTKQLITIDEENRKYEGQVLLHEVLHAIDYVYNNAILTEEQVERLSQGLYDFLRNNKIEWRK